MGGNNKPGATTPGNASDIQNLASAMKDLTKQMTKINAMQLDNSSNWKDIEKHSGKVTDSLEEHNTILKSMTKETTSLLGNFVNVGKTLASIGTGGFLAGIIKDMIDLDNEATWISATMGHGGKEAFNLGKSLENVKNGLSDAYNGAKDFITTAGDRTVGENFQLIGDKIKSGTKSLFDAKKNSQSYIDYLKTSVTDLEKEYGTSYEHAKSYIMELAQIKFDGNIKEAAAGVDLFSRSTRVSSESVIELTANLGKTANMSEKSINAMFAQMVKTQQNVGISQKGMQSLVNTVSQLSANMAAFGKSDQDIKKMITSTTALVGAMEKVGISAERSTQLVDQLTDPDRIEDNILLYSQLGISMEEAMSGDFRIEDYGDKFQALGEKIIAMGPVAGAQFAKMMGTSYKEAKKFSQLQLGDQQKLEEETKTTEEQSLDALKQLTEATEGIGKRAESWLNKIEGWIKGLPKVILVAAPLLIMVGKKIIKSIFGKKHINASIRDGFSGVPAEMEAAGKKASNGFFGTIFMFGEKMLDKGKGLVNKAVNGIEGSISTSFTKSNIGGLVKGLDEQVEAIYKKASKEPLLNRMFDASKINLANKFKAEEEGIKNSIDNVKAKLGDLGVSEEQLKDAFDETGHVKSKFLSGLRDEGKLTDKQIEGVEKLIKIQERLNNRQEGYKFLQEQALGLSEEQRNKIKEQEALIENNNNLLKAQEDAQAKVNELLEEQKQDSKKIQQLREEINSGTLSDSALEIEKKQLDDLIKKQNELNKARKEKNNLKEVQEILKQEADFNKRIQVALASGNDKLAENLEKQIEKLQKKYGNNPVEIAASLGMDEEQIKSVFKDGTSSLTEALGAVESAIGAMESPLEDAQEALEAANAAVKNGGGESGLKEANEAAQKNIDEAKKGSGAEPKFYQKILGTISNNFKEKIGFGKEYQDSLAESIGKAMQENGGKELNKDEMKKIKRGAVKQQMKKNVASGATKALSKGLGGIKSALGGLGRMIGPMAIVSALVGKVMDKVRAPLEKMLNVIVDSLDPLMQTLMPIISNLLQTIGQKVLPPILRAIAAILPVLHAILQPITWILKLVGKIVSIIPGIGKGLESVINGVVDAANAITGPKTVEALNNAADTMEQTSFAIEDNTKEKEKEKEKEEESETGPEIITVEGGEFVSQGTTGRQNNEVNKQVASLNPNVGGESESEKAIKEAETRKNEAKKSSDLSEIKENIIHLASIDSGVQAIANKKPEETIREARSGSSYAYKDSSTV